MSSILLPVIFFIYWILLPFKEEKLYYIPQAKLYVKTVKKTMSEYGYAVFSKDSLCYLSDKNDYIKWYKSDLYLNIIIYPIEGNKIIIADNNIDVVALNQVKFEIIKMDSLPSNLTRKMEVSGTRIDIFKYPHIYLAIDGFLQSISIADDSAKLHRLSPID